MSNKVDIAALRAHAHELRDMHFGIDEGDDSLYVHGGVDGGIYPVESLLRRNKDAIVALLNAAPALLDELAMRRLQVDDMSEDISKIELRAETAEAEFERLREALTPSGATKAAYSGEFQIRTTMYDDDNNEHVADTTVPWTTIKDIMDAISTRAALAAQEPK